MENSTTDNKNSITESSMRVLYFSEEYGNQLVRLSRLVKDDSNNTILWSSDGCCLEDKNFKKTQENISQNLKEEKSSSNKNEVAQQHLIKFLIREILFYLDNKSLINKCLGLNKTILNMINITLEERTFNYKRHLRATNNANIVYTSFEVSDFLFPDEILFDVDLKVESKDQGWASASVSSSWVEMKFKNTSGEKDLVVPLALNYKDRNFKTTQLIFSGQKNSKCDKKIFENLSNRNNKVEIIARCQYPGWECHVNSFIVVYRAIKVHRN
jgi:hypothetical protein